MSRYINPPVFRLPIWIMKHQLFYAKKSDLEDAIKKSGNSTECIITRMGLSYHLLLDALEGKLLDKYAIKDIEHGLIPAGPNPKIHPPKKIDYILKNRPYFN